jgi:hypothetical protein
VAESSWGTIEMGQFTIDRKKARSPSEQDIYVVTDKSGPTDWAKYYFVDDDEGGATLDEITKEKSRTDRTTIAEFLLRNRNSTYVVYDTDGSILAELQVQGDE